MWWCHYVGQSFPNWYPLADNICRSRGVLPPTWILSARAHWLQNIAQSGSPLRSFCLFISSFRNLLLLRCLTLPCSTTLFLPRLPLCRSGLTVKCSLCYSRSGVRVPSLSQLAQMWQAKKAGSFLARAAALWDSQQPRRSNARAPFPRVRAFPLWMLPFSAHFLVRLDRHLHQPPLPIICKILRSTCFFSDFHHFIFDIFATLSLQALFFFIFSFLCYSSDFPFLNDRVF